MDVRKINRRQKPPATSQEKTVEIKVALPFALKLPSRAALQQRFKRLPASRRRLLVGGGICVIAIASWQGYGWLTNDKTNVAGVQTGDPAFRLTRGTPDYATILPKDKTIEALGGWVRVSPPKSNPVFAYVDTIDSATISVSQQPLPDKFKKDTAKQIEQLALDLKAREKITVEGTTVHIGMSAKGPQSIMFTKNNLLILIKSDVRIDNSQLAKYIASLQQ